MMRLPRSIQGRVLLLAFCAAGLLWVTLAAKVWFEARHELDELLDAHLAQAASLLVAQQLPELDDDHGIDAPVLHRYAPRVAFQVFHEGRLALRSVNAPATPIVAPGQAPDNTFTTARVDGGTWRVFATRGHEKDVVVLVAEDVRSRGSILTAIMRTTFGPLLLGLPLLAIGLWWSVRRALQPVGAIGRALSARKADDFSPVARAGAPSELEPMLDSLDQLLVRISTLLEGERRFTADAAHELRTPLAAIRAQAQVALAETDPEARRHALEATIEGSDRAVRLAEQLLALARLDAQAAPALQPVDLAAVARGVLAQWSAAALAKQQDIRLEGGERPVEVAGDATLLAALVGNLAGNAVRYAPAGAAIRVALEPAGQRWVLVVENSSAPLATADLERLGERFFRVLGTGESGSGLGLSIVKRIAQLHGAEVDFSAPAELGGLRVKVSFPAPAPSARPREPGREPA